MIDEFSQKRLLNTVSQQINEFLVTVMDRPDVERGQPIVLPAVSMTLHEWIERTKNQIRLLDLGMIFAFLGPLPHLRHVPIPHDQFLRILRAAESFGAEMESLSHEAPSLKPVPDINE